ncbi:sulfite exporter TauE/SafE family protein [Candidatus Woesearchaeota archaeon]|nr:sulfite exporter TauE/SafE family protein [Candidatus Woesearchaeota archaeon]
MNNVKPKQWQIFLNSVFFVLGFSVLFSLVGVLLQGILSRYAYSVQNWLGYIGGSIIILFGLYLLGLIKIDFLEQEHKVHVKRRFKYSYLTSFVFGAAFAAGWTPCVGAVLGAVLSLAITQPGTAFFLMLAYSLGLGIPFLVVGLFTNQAQRLISKAGKWIAYGKYVFGVILILLGILVFANQLNRVANLSFASELIIALNSSSLFSGSSLNIGIAFIAGLFSFLSPCVLPLIPAFLAYLASIGVKNGTEGVKNDTT